MPRPLRLGEGDDGGKLQRGRVSGRRGRLKGDAADAGDVFRRRRGRLTLLGYIAFLDPPKETCAGAIATLKASGVQVKILTRDNDIVTRKILHELAYPWTASF